MIYIFETNLPDKKSVIFALTYIYGLGKSNSSLICKKLGFSKNLKIKDLSNEQINKINNIIENLQLNVGSDLKKIKTLKFKNLISIKSYRGFRKNKGLPVRGQRTHSNARTARKIK